jgi:hypothetical protein
MRFQFPLYKLFLSFIVCAFIFAKFCPLGIFGTIIALVTGTAAGALVLLIRTRDELVSASISAVGGTIGTALAYVATTPKVVRPRITNADYVNYWIALSIGAAVGGLFFPWARRRESRTSTRTRATPDCEPPTNTASRRSADEPSIDIRA